MKLKSRNRSSDTHFLKREIGSGSSGKEVQQHTNVNSNDPIIRERYSYQYNLQYTGLVTINQGTSMESYVRHYNFTISNIDIMDTMAYIKEDGDEWVQGSNLIRIYVAEVPEDRPESTPVFRMAEVLVNIYDQTDTIILSPSDFTLLQ